jgi:hypothetical protein
MNWNVRAYTSREADTPMFRPRLRDRPLLLGLAIGSVFGCVNLIMTWRDPLEDDTPAALLRFYGPMFLLWVVVSLRAARQNGRLISGVTAGVLVALTTFIAFDVLILLRVNLFLGELTGRADWQDLVLRFHESGANNLRAFVVRDYLTGAPFKCAVSCGIGGIMGLIGGSIGRMTYRPIQSACWLLLR